MSDTFSKVEVITGVARRRRFSTDLKLAVVAETMQPGMSVSDVARRHGLSPSLVFRWRRLMSEGGKEAVRADDAVVPASEVRRLEERVRELERLLGRKTMEVEMLKEALDLARAKNRPCCRTRRFREISGEGGRHDAGRGALECRRTPLRQKTPTRTPGSCWRCRAGRCDPSLCRRAT
jgi:transposase